MRSPCGFLVIPKIPLAVNRQGGFLEISFNLVIVDILEMIEHDMTPIIKTMLDDGGQ